MRKYLNLFLCIMLVLCMINIKMTVYATNYFIGDSRTVDMFSGKKTKINNKVFGNMIVYAKDGATYTYLKSIVKKNNISKGDTIITWLGANDHGNFSNYEKYYNKLRRKNINIILCTIGCSDDNKLHDEGDHLYYNDSIMRSFNKKLVKYANENDIHVIDLYKYTKKYITVQPDNGVHYLPKPNKKLQKYILKKLCN